MAAITARELELQMPDASKLLSDEPEMESSFGKKKYLRHHSIM